jgi:sulfatase maturation enzyme AslB (radical SAM superfamily)
MFVSHQGLSLCCINPDKHKNIMPSEFWRGEVRKAALAKMESGNEVRGCQKCYITEAKRIPSGRTFATLYDNIPTKALPTMLDLDFSNFCNLKCVMCDEVRSSEWAKDLGQPISTVTTALIDDLLTISDDLQHLTIQGGEPTIMKEYEYYFSELEKKGVLERVDLQIITNVTNVNQRFYELLSKFRKVRLSVSIDAHGLANNYIRWPSNFEQIEKNLIKISELPTSIEVELFNSLNALSMFNYYDFLKWCKNIENIYSEKSRIFRVVPMKVQKPMMYSPFHAPKSLKDKFIGDVKRFLSEDKLSHNSNWKTETLLLTKQINATPEDEQAMSDLRQAVLDLDSKRNVKITNYIPNFYEYL